MYIAGIGNEREPALHCDTAGCGTVMTVKPTRYGMPAWLRDRKAPKGWRTVIIDDRRRDTCPRCRHQNPEACEEVLQGLDSAYSLREWDAMREDRDQFQRRAEQAERALADLAALIHTESGLDDHRYTAEQMVTEMASGWEHESAGREQAERERDEAVERCKSLEYSLEEAERGGKYCVKARAYGAIACEFRKTLQAFSDRGEALAKAALEWRYSESNGVPMSAIETMGELLDALTERDALKAKLAGAEREKLRWSGIADHAEKMLELAWLELGPDDNHVTVAGGIRDLRARAEAAERERDEAMAEISGAMRAYEIEGDESLFDMVRRIASAAVSRTTEVATERAAREKAEAVVEAARNQQAWIDAHNREPRAAKDPYDRAYVDALDAARTWLADALRAYAAAQAKDSGGSGAAPCQHRKTRCENDLDVCVACGAVNRAVTGILDWGHAEPHKTSAGKDPNGREPKPVPEPADSFLVKLRDGGSIVGSAACSEVAIAIARASDRMHVDADGFGYVYVRGEPYGHISKADERQLDSDSPVGVAATAESAGEWQGSGGSKHRCSVCGCYWRLNDPTDAQPDGSWSLWDGRQKPGQCCDNVRMGEQIKPGPPLTRADLAALEERIVERVEHACWSAIGKDLKAFPALEALADELRRKP